MPAPDPPPALPPPEPELGSDLAPKILVVDPVSERGAELVAKLGAEGFRAATCAATSEATRQSAIQFRPWVIVLHDAPPALDGLARCGDLKRDEEVSYIPVVLVSTQAYHEPFAIAAMETGACAVVPSEASTRLLISHIYVQLDRYGLIMESRGLNRHLRELVVRDPMTGLYNHAHLHEVLGNEISRSLRIGFPVSLLLIDLDNFKNINDSYGHPVGDVCLKTLAGELTSGGRRSDLAARYGGDEFALVLPATAKAGAAVKGQAIRHRLGAIDYSAFGIPAMTISVGVASCPDDAHDVGSLVDAADKALYRAKRAGRDRVCSFVSEGDALRADDGEGVDHLRRIIADEALSFVYQPVMHRESGHIVGYEALCRSDDELFAGPLELFDEAERTGQVKELGRVCRRASLAPLQLLAAEQLLFVNLHPLELCNELMDEAQTELKDVAHRIVLELTRSATIQQPGRQRDLVTRLKELGFLIALDDVSYDYDALTTIAALKPNIIKLGMPWLRSTTQDAEAAMLLRHILDFASQEQIDILVKGVETQADQSLAQEHQVAMLQGFALGRPRHTLAQDRPPPAKPRPAAPASSAADDEQILT